MADQQRRESVKKDKKKLAKSTNREADKEQLQCFMCNKIFTDNDDDILLQCEHCSEW